MNSLDIVKLVIISPWWSEISTSKTLEFLKKNSGQLRWNPYIVRLLVKCEVFWYMFLSIYWQLLSLSLQSVKYLELHERLVKPLL